MTRHRMPSPHRFRLVPAAFCTAIAATLAAAAAVPAAASAAPSAAAPALARQQADARLSHQAAAPLSHPGPRDEGRWLGSWAASPQQARPAGLTGPTDPTVTGFSNQTVREIVHLSIGGGALRVRLSNAFSSAPLVVGDATAAREGDGAALAGAPVPVTFHGHHSVTIRAGGTVLSDPARLPVSPLENLAVSLYLPGMTGPTTNHDFAAQANFISGTGDHAQEQGAAAYTQQAFSWFYLSGVEVQPRHGDASDVVTLGDSITDGVGSTTSANHRWPDILAARLAAAGQQVGVLNEGISGNRILNASPCFGTSALSRLPADVLSQPGARTVILLEGINDIGFPTQANSGCTAPNTAVSAQQIETGYRQIIARAHADGLRIIGATLTPIGGSFYDAPATEAERTAVNIWIRTSHAFDAVIDFDKVVQDPADPNRMLPAFDSGDHLHPSDAGYQAMADAINLALVTGHHGH